MSYAVFVANGNAIDYAPSIAVNAGDVVVQGDLVGVACSAIAAGALGSLTVAGVFDFPKATGASTAISVGSKVYWDATNHVVTTSDGAGTNKLIGKTVRDAADSDTTARVRLSQ